jgi:hypothetical protein
VTMSSRAAPLRQTSIFAVAPGLMSAMATGNSLEAHGHLLSQRIEPRHSAPGVDHAREHTLNLP